VGVFESIERYPVAYNPTGDRAILIAWAVKPTTVGVTTVHEVCAVLCLEDGTAVEASLSEIRFDYRYDLANQAWIDTSRPIGQPPAEGDNANADQEDADDGSPEVPG